MLVTPAERAAESISRLMDKSREPSSTPGNIWQCISLNAIFRFAISYLEFALTVSAL